MVYFWIVTSTNHHSRIMFNTPPGMVVIYSAVVQERTISTSKVSLGTCSTCLVLFPISIYVNSTGRQHKILGHFPCAIFTNVYHIIQPNESTLLAGFDSYESQSITPIFTSQKRLKAADWSEQPLSNINKRIILHGCLEG